MTNFDFGAVAYGFWRYNENDFAGACEALEAAREAGISHFDTADIYGHECGVGSAERLLGKFRKEAPSLLEGATVATKGGIVLGTPYNSSPTYLESALHASLSNLGTDRIDLYYIHRPDELTHPADLAETLDRFIEQGKIGAVAVSNFRPRQIDALRTYLTTPLVAHQIEFSVVHHQPISDGLLDQAMELDLAVPVWSPLAGGALFSAENRTVSRVRDAVEAVAERTGRTPTEVALSFVLSHPARTIPILGTRNPERIREGVRAAEAPLSREDWYTLYVASRGERMP